MPALVTFSERRLAANRANAQLSTGPVTAEGKAKFSLNAVKTGLTGRAVLLADEEEAAMYKAHIERLRRYRQDAKELKELQAKRKGEQEEQLKQERPKETPHRKSVPPPAASNLQISLNTVGSRKQVQMVSQNHP